MNAFMSLVQKNISQRFPRSLFSWHVILDKVLRIDKLSIDLMSDCYHVRDIHIEVAYFFPGSEVCSTFPSLSETLTFAGLWVPQKE